MPVSVFLTYYAYTQLAFKTYFKSQTFLRFVSSCSALVRISLAALSVEKMNKTQWNVTPLGINWLRTVIHIANQFLYLEGGDADKASFEGA